MRRYQLGIPVWRALGGACEIELAGLPHVLAGDRTAVLLDVREADDFRKGTLPGRLPMEDHNTRVIVLAQDPAHARYVAEAIAREAFHNVSYFPGTLDEARAAVPQ